MRLTWASAAACGLLAAAALGAEPERVEIKLEHKGDVFGEGGDWDRQYAREALQIFKDLKPDPEWVAKLQGLPDNTWMRAKAAGEQEPEPGRSEVPMVYAPEAHAFVFCCGCTSPGYSSDTWVYHTASNRWVQMWPNYIKGSAKLNRGPCPKDRPWTRCSLGLTWDSDGKRIILRGGANGNETRTWGWDPATNAWRVEAGPETGYQYTGGNNLGFVPGFGVVEVGSGSIMEKGSRDAETWRFKPDTKTWEKLATKGAPPVGQCTKLVWAAKAKRLVYWSPKTDALWAFDPAALAWEDLTPQQGDRPKGFYRQGTAYDSANDVFFMFGTKPENNPKPGGPWIYDFAKKSWQDMKTPGGPNPAGQGMPLDYDPEHNVVFMRGGWFYRYRRAAEAGR